MDMIEIFEKDLEYLIENVSSIDDENKKLSISIIAEADILIETRIGGGVLGLESVKFYHKEGYPHWLAFEKESDGIIVMQLFESSQSFVDWWIDKFAGENEDVVTNRIPPKIKLQEFILILHGIDMYRRISYKNMLEHKFAENLNLDYKEFADELAISLKSMDVRWLLPAFLNLMPNINNFDIDIKPEDANVLFEQMFFLNMHAEETNKDFLIFGEAGKSMGIEFFRTWYMGAGFEVKRLELSDWKSKSFWFFAPTSISNHFVEIELSDKNQAMVNHQAYTKDQFKIKIKKILDEIY